MRQEQEGGDKPARILLVADDPHLAPMIDELLRAAWPGGLIIGHTTRIADAVREVADHGATCVLLGLATADAAVPALEQLIAVGPHTPIVVVTDVPPQDGGIDVVRAGAQDVLGRSELTAPSLTRAVRHAIERKAAEAALALQALHDPLTTLPNRALFLDRLRVALDRSRRTGTAVVVMFLDVDGFKQINDSLGHAAGDLVLTVLADRFSRLLRPMDTVARFGGDEFTFLFEGLDGARDASLLAERICESAGLPVTFGERRLSLSASVGVSVVSDPETALEPAIGRADAAMYRAKQLGGGRYVLAEEDAPRLVRSADDLESALQRALTRGELRVHYQPRISINGTTDLVGFEALVRWEHPQLGLMEPVDFIPVAEESGLIVPLGDWVLEQALAQVERWRRSRPGVTISVNLSGRQLGDEGLIERLRAAIRRGGHDPDVLCLEVPEEALAAEPTVAGRQLAALHELGVRLAVDDYGTGHSDRSALERMPLHVLKIDKALVSDLGTTRGDPGTVGDAVALGHGLGLCVVAEGVETDAQLLQVRDLGFDGAQGFLFSRPMPEEGVHSLLGSR